MKEIIEKLTIIKDKILSEKTNGRLRFLGLIARTDIEGKWDLLLSADWIKKNSSETDLIYIIQKLKDGFAGNLDFLSRIVLLTPNETFVQQLARTITREDLKNGEEITSLKISADFTVRKMLYIFLDFQGIDLNTIQETEDEPVAIKNLQV